MIIVVVEILVIAILLEMLFVKMVALAQENLQGQSLQKNVNNFMMVLLLVILEMVVSLIQNIVAKVMRHHLLESFFSNGPIPIEGAVCCGGK